MIQVNSFWYLINMATIPPYLIQIGADKVNKAKTLFGTLINQYAGANLIQQITAAGKTKLIADAVRDVMYYGTTGSLWEAYSAVEAIQVTPEMAPFITEDIKQDFKNKLIGIISSL